MKFFAPFFALAFLPAFPAQAADFDIVGREMSRMLQNGHYARLPFNKDLSARIFDDYLEDIDPDHLYFTQEDISEFSKKYRRELHTLLVREKAMAAAKEIFVRYQKRVKERISVAQDLLKNNEFTFDSDRFVPRDRKDTPWPKDDAAATAQWKLELEDLLLTEMMYRENAQRLATEQGKADPYLTKPSPSEKLSQQYERILQTTEQSDEEDIANYFFSAAARAHDPHTEYLSARETDQFYSRMSNKLVGIGATLVSEDDGSTRITGIVNGGPADKSSDLQLDDRIIAVAPSNQGKWVDTRFMPLDKVIEKIKGEADTQVALKVEPAEGKNDEHKIIVINRGLVKMKADLTTSEIFSFSKDDAQSKIGLLEVPSFYFDRDDRSRNVSVHVEKIVRRMIKENIDGLIIDMRGNGGGSLDEVRRMTGLFIGRGPVVQIKSYNGQIKSLESLYRKPIYSGPIVLLTDKGSASATEIFAAALQDYNRAVIVGSSSTFGKGTVQNPQEISQFMPILSDRDRAGTLKLTIQKYYRASGNSVQLKGVVPDVILPAHSDAFENGEKFAKHALPFDIIRKASGLHPFSRQDLFISDLQAQSKKRVDANQDFAYISEDVIRYQTQREENRKSLNREFRRTEIATNVQRRNKRNAERRERFAVIEKEDTDLFTVQRLTLDDLKSDTLPLIDRKATESSYIRKSANKIKDLDDTPDWPSGLDNVKREGFSILQDLITLTGISRTAGILQKP